MGTRDAVVSHRLWGTTTPTPLESPLIMGTMNPKVPQNGEGKTLGKAPSRGRSESEGSVQSSLLRRWTNRCTNAFARGHRGVHRLETACPGG